MTKRKVTKKNVYPKHETYRHISSVLRDQEGYMCFSEEENGVLYIRRTNIKDLKEITPNKNGQRCFRRSFIESHLRKSVVAQDYKGELYMYCIHERQQKLRSWKDFTTNKRYPHLRTTEYIYGLQPFCKESKKKYVNNGPAGNSSRTQDQYLEDIGNRLRQKIIVATLGYNPKIDYEHIHAKYDGRCFRCEKTLPLEETKLKQLDHTLPHSLYWPYTTENATLLCVDCNQAKSNRWPADFYTTEQQKKLSSMTEIPFELLCSKEPKYNIELFKQSIQNIDDVWDKIWSSIRTDRKKSIFIDKLEKEFSLLRKQNDDILLEYVNKMSEKLQNLKRSKRNEI